MSAFSKFMKLFSVAGGVRANVDPVNGGISFLAGSKRASLLDSTAWPMTVPGVMQTPIAVTNGVANAASAIAGSILHSPLLPSKMTLLGGPAPRGFNYPDYTGVVLGKYPQSTTTSPTAIEFNFDSADATGRFEISMKGNGQSYRVMVKQNGAWQASSQFAQRIVPSDGNGYLDLVALGAAGAYQVRVEFSGGVFYGIRTSSTDTVSPIAVKRKRYIVVGDSFTEPTISDSGTKFTGAGGWVQQLAYITGYDIWSAGSGGTGYVATNGALPKFYDRLANDVLAFNPDGVIFAGGINDSASDIQTFADQVQSCLSLCEGKEIIVLSPFWPKGFTGFPVTLLQYRDVLKDKSASAGACFLDLLSYGGQPEFLLAADKSFSTTLSSQYVSGNSITVANIPAYFKQAMTGNDKWFVNVSNGAAAQVVREVVGISGSGPYVLSVNALGAAFPAGSVVTISAPSYQTGTGKQGAAVGDGNSDRYTGGDGTHPTMVGHANIARCVADLWSRSLTAGVSL